MTEGPYKLPESWRWVRLGEVCQCERRTVDPRRSPKATFYLYSIPAYDESQRPERLDGSQIGSSKVVIGPGVCLFSKLNPRIPRAWVVVGVPQDGMPVASTEFMPLRPNPNVLDLDYLGKLLMTEWFVSQVRLDVTGATGSRQRLKPGVILNARVPLPPLDEQRRIVARLEELMSRVREARRLRQEAEEDAERLMQAALAEVFPRPGAEPPTGWRWVRLGEMARREAVLLRPSDHPSRRFRYLGMEHVAAGQWAEPEAVEVNGEEIKSPVVVFRPGLVLYGKLRPYLNKVVVPRSDGVASTEFVPIAPIPDFVSAEYLAAFLRTPYFVAYATRNTTGSRQPRTRLEALWNAFIPLPPLDEQRGIVARLEALQEKVRSLKASQAETVEKLKQLEQSILDRVFRGEL